VTLEQLQKQERLTVLRQKLQLGTYTVPPRIIADAIIRRGLDRLRLQSC
jgi:anti-sigma28 factor (negative regulator of flagellin synthesis)